MVGGSNPLVWQISEFNQFNLNYCDVMLVQDERVVGKIDLVTVIVTMMENLATQAVSRDSRASSSSSSSSSASDDSYTSDFWLCVTVSPSAVSENNK